MHAVCAPVEAGYPTRLESPSAATSSLTKARSATAAEALVKVLPLATGRPASVFSRYVAGADTASVSDSQAVTLLGGRGRSALRRRARVCGKAAAVAAEKGDWVDFPGWPLCGTPYA